MAIKNCCAQSKAYLEGHSVLGSLQGHGSKRIDKPRSHRGIEHIEQLTRDAQILVHASELVVGAHLHSPHYHRAIDEGSRAAKEGFKPFLPHDALEGINYALVVAALLYWLGSIVGDAYQGNFSGTADHSGESCIKRRMKKKKKKKKAAGQPIN